MLHLSARALQISHSCTMTKVWIQHIRYRRSLCYYHRLTKYDMKAPKKWSPILSVAGGKIRYSRSLFLLKVLLNQNSQRWVLTLSSYHATMCSALHLQLCRLWCHQHKMVVLTYWISWLHFCTEGEMGNTMTNHYLEYVSVDCLQSEWPQPVRILWCRSVYNCILAVRKENLRKWA